MGTKRATGVDRWWKVGDKKWNDGGQIGKRSLHRPDDPRPRIRVVRYACGPHGPHVPRMDRPGRSSGCPDRVGDRRPAGPEKEESRLYRHIGACERFPGSPPALLPAGRQGAEAPHDPRGPRKLPGVVRTNRPAEVPKASGRAKTRKNPHIGSKYIV
jgi:hypothetical protein